MLAIGTAAFFLRRRGYEMAPLVLGLVLGHLLDKSLRRGLVLSDGSLLPFFTRPICMVFAAVTLFTILLYVPGFKAGINWVRSALVPRVRGSTPSCRMLPSVGGSSPTSAVRPARLPVWNATNSPR